MILAVFVENTGSARQDFGKMPSLDACTNEKWSTLPSVHTDIESVIQAHSRCFLSFQRCVVSLNEDGSEAYTAKGC
jgi:hypothetical protein